MDTPAFSSAYRRPRLSVDGVSSRPPQHVPTYAVQSSRTQVRPFQHPTKHYQNAKIKRNHKLWEHAQVPLVVIACSVIGFFVQILWLGIILVLAYGIMAAIFRIKSHITFTLTIIAFVAVAVAKAAGSQNQMANNFAAYAFLLLTIGVITLAIEARPRRRKKHHRGR